MSVTTVTPFSNAKGNAADTCQELTSELLLGRLDYNAAIAKPIKAKNRAVAVLKESWGIYNNRGAVAKRPNSSVLRAIGEKWDDELASGEKHLSVGHALYRLCMPPYGANIASAGLILGTFVSPRSEKIAIVKDGEQLAVSQWHQNGIYRGKFIDIRALHDVFLVMIGEDASEWDTLLDEWEQAEAYLNRKQILERALELKRRVPVPPVQIYRYEHLMEQSKLAIQEIVKVDRDVVVALNRIEKASSRSDVGDMSRGAAELLSLIKKMTTEGSRWTDNQLKELQPHFERARQLIIQCFPEWISRQSPPNSTPAGVGDWKHLMLRLVGANLTALELTDQYTDLQAHVQHRIRNVETITEAGQLVHDIGNWITQNADACRILRMARLRGLRDVGKEFSKKLQGMATRIALVEVSEMRAKLTQFIEQMKATEADIMKRAEKLWNAKLRNHENMGVLAAEIAELVRIFEGCDTDLADFHLMEHAVKGFEAAYMELQSEKLSWNDFADSACRLKDSMNAQFGEEGLPWQIDEVFEQFIKEISRSRETKGKDWLGAAETDMEQLDSMHVSYVNRLYNRFLDVPAYLTDAQVERQRKMRRKVEDRLQTLAVEWLLEKFSELPNNSRRVFLQAASELTD